MNKEKLYEIQDQVNTLMKDTNSMAEICSIIQKAQDNLESVDQVSNVIWLFQRIIDQMSEAEKQIFDEMDEYIMGCEKGSGSFDMCCNEGISDMKPVE